MPLRNIVSGRLLWVHGACSHSRLFSRPRALSPQPLAPSSLPFALRAVFSGSPPLCCSPVGVPYTWIAPQPRALPRRSCAPPRMSTPLAPRAPNMTPIQRLVCAKIEHLEAHAGQLCNEPAYVAATMGLKGEWIPEGLGTRRILRNDPPLESPRPLSLDSVICWSDVLQRRDPSHQQALASARARHTDIALCTTSVLTLRPTHGQDACAPARRNDLAAYGRACGRAARVLCKGDLVRTAPP